jgi:hypothetical protein
MTNDSSSAWSIRVAKTIVLIRILVGWVFLSEGIQKFLFPDTLGVGRLAKIGIPWPHAMDLGQVLFLGTERLAFAQQAIIGLRKFATPISRQAFPCLNRRRTGVLVRAQKSKTWRGRRSEPPRCAHNGLHRAVQLRSRSHFR